MSIDREYHLRATWVKREPVELNLNTTDQTQAQRSVQLLENARGDGWTLDNVQVLTRGEWWIWDQIEAAKAECVRLENALFDYRMHRFPSGTDGDYEVMREEARRDPN